MLGIRQLKGQPKHLSGKLLAYARIPVAPEEKSPLRNMVHNGLLVVCGNFIEQHSFRDFIRKEFDSNAANGIGDFLEKLGELGGDLPEGMDTQDLRQKLEEFSHMEIIPIPAKVMHYDDEESILSEDGDIFFLGEFKRLNQAHLAATSFPILYQSYYREQQSLIFETEIGSLLHNIEQNTLTLLPDPEGDPSVLHLQGDLNSFRGHLLELLTGEVLPHLVYNLGNRFELQQSLNNFRRFMKPFRHPETLDTLELALTQINPDNISQRRKLELLCQKISALHHEEFESLVAIQRELETL